RRSAVQSRETRRPCDGSYPLNLDRGRLRGAAPPVQCAEGRSRGGRSVEELHTPAPGEALEVLDQLARGPHVPLGAEIERAARPSRAVLDGDGARAVAPRLEQRREARDERSRLARYGPAQNEAARIALARRVQIGDAPRGKTPAVAELIEAQHSLDEH